jgi:hypothetical protein
MSDQDVRVGMNEALFREVNERIENLQDELGGGSSFEIVCECGNADCIERFPITDEAYESLRRDARLFAVVPGHQLPDIERTVETHDGYLVVEKTDPEAVHVAEETA